MKTLCRKAGITLALSITLIAASCGSNGDSTATTEATTTTTPTVTQPDSPAEPTTAAAEPTTSEVSTPPADASLTLSDRGMKLADFPSGGRFLWAQPSDGTPGCGSKPGWVVLSDSIEGGDLKQAIDIIFQSAPGMWFTRDEGAVVLTAGCENMSYQVIGATLNPAGTLDNSHDVYPGNFEEFRIDAVAFLNEQNQLAFDLGKGDNAAPTIAIMDASTEAVVDTFVLGDPAVGCSAQSMTVSFPEDDAITDAARATRDAVAAAAVACDFEALDAIAPDSFGYSFGGDQNGPGPYWARFEQVYGMPMLENLVKIMSVAPATPSTIGDTTTASAWPAVSVLPPPSLVNNEAARDELLALGFEPDYVDSVMKGDDFYFGYRTAISDDGLWLYFQIGD